MSLLGVKGRLLGASHNNHVYILADGVLFRTKTFLNWDQVNLPVNLRNYSCLISHRGHLYCMTLPGARNFTSYLHRLNFSKETPTEWVPVPSAKCPCKAWFDTGLSLDARIVFAGCWDGSRSCNTIIAYNTISGKWEAHWPALPAPVTSTSPIVMPTAVCLLSGHSLWLRDNHGVLQQQAVFIDLHEGKGKPGTAWSFDKDGSYIPPPPHESSSGVFLFGKVFVCGGSNEKFEATGKCYILDATKKNWLRMPPLRVPRIAPCLVIFHDCVLAIGKKANHRHQPSVHLASIEMLKLSSDISVGNVSVLS